MNGRRSECLMTYRPHLLLRQVDGTSFGEASGMVDRHRFPSALLSVHQGRLLFWLIRCLFGSPAVIGHRRGPS
jgi:hypothetical protein